MATTTIKNLTLLGLMQLGLLQPLFAQEAPLKNYAETHNQAKFCFYPSTLRMINIQKNEAMNELASSFEKLLIYQLDSTSAMGKKYQSIVRDYTKNGFEEYMTIYGSGNKAMVLGKEQRTNELVGYLGKDDMVFVFYLLGNIEWQKLPTLFSTLSENDLLNIFELDAIKWD